MLRWSLTALLLFVLAVPLLAQGRPAPLRSPAPSLRIVSGVDSETGSITVKVLEYRPEVRTVEVKKAAFKDGKPVELTEKVSVTVMVPIEVEQLWGGGKDDRAVDGAGKKLTKKQVLERVKAGDTVLYLIGTEVDFRWLKALRPEAVILLAVPPGRIPSPDPKDSPAKPAEKVEGLSRSEQQVIDLTNAQRKTAGLEPLRVSMKLMKAARDHSANMASKGRIAHELDGKVPPDRLKDVEYAHRGCGENCAGGQRTAAQAVEAWLRSPGHRANILSERYTEIGVGMAQAGSGVRYWTQVFAVPLE